MTKNMIIGIIQNEIFKENIPKELYEENRKIYITKSNEKIGDLKKYL